MTKETTQALLSQRWQILQAVIKSPVLRLVLEEEITRIDNLVLAIEGEAK